MNASHLETLRHVRELFEDEDTPPERLAEQLRRIADLLEERAEYREPIARLLHETQPPEEDSRTAYVTTTQAAQILGMSVPTVRKIASRGQIPHYFVGTHMRFRPEAIQNYKQRLMGLEELLELDADSHALGDDDYLLDD